MEGNFQVQLLGGKTTMSDRKILVDKLDGKHWCRSIKGCSFLDTRWGPLKSGELSNRFSWPEGLPRISPLPDCFGDDTER